MEVLRLFNVLDSKILEINIDNDSNKTKTIIESSWLIVFSGLA